MTLDFEVVAYAGALLVAALLRLAKPEWPLLTDDQAAQALAAAAASRVPLALPLADAIAGAINPLYHAWTTLLFQATGLTEGSARLMGELAGSGLVLVPWMLRRTFGRWPALLGAWLLATAPILVGVSRMPASGMIGLLAVGLGLAGLLAWPASRRADIGLGICLGAAAASGPEAITGIVGVALGTAIYLGLRNRVVDPLPEPAARNGRVVGISAIVTFMLGSTAFGLVTSGLPAGLGAVGTWLSGWTSVASVSGLTLLGAIAIYQPLWLVMGVAGMLSATARRSAVGGWLACWMLGSLAVAIVYPGRSLQSLIWPTAAVSVLAGLPLADLLTHLRDREAWPTRLGLALAMLLLLLFGGLQLVGYSSGSVAATSPVLGPSQQLLLAMAALLMAGLMALLIGLGWSWGESRVVTGSVVLLVLALLSVAAIWRLNFSLWAGTGQEISTRLTATMGQRLMAGSVAKIAAARRSSADPVTVQVMGSLPPSLAWSLRAAPVDWLAASASEAPGILLLPEPEYEVRAPALQAEYRGQSLAVRARWGWRSLLPPDLLNWYFRAIAPVEHDRWVLLVRTDLVEPDLLPGVSVQP
jgi:hypothetical protein